MLLRGIGPSLHQNGVPGFLRDPNLTLLNADGMVLAYNDNWVDSPDKDAINATGLAPSDDREPAILSSLMPGFYTSVMRGAQNRSGVGVIEAYDLQPPNSSLYIAAAGTRGQVLTGDNVLVSGVILGGPGSVSLLVRTLGPSLATAGLHRVLADPYLYIVSANGDIIASNDNWGDNFNKDQIIATGLAPDDDLEPALLLTLSPSVYTAVATGVDGDTGLAFTQIYSLTFPPLELDPAPIIRGR